jgi:peptide/nickel transport system permease protein
MSIDIQTAGPPEVVEELADPRKRPRRGFWNVLFLVVGSFIVLVFAAMAIAPDVIAKHPPNDIYIGEPLVGPSSAFWMGTDELGRDMFSRVVHGTRTSIGMAVLVVALGALAGTLIGAIAGFVGGVVDDLLMRFTDLFLSLPGFVLALAIAAVLGRGISSVVIALALVWWPGYARLVRGIVLDVKQRLHVEAARTLGASGPHIVRRHILPFTVRQLNTRITQDMGYALVSVAGLSFLGLGAQPPAPEWGSLLNASRTHLVGAWWYPTFPGLAIMIFTLGVSLLGDALSERLGRDDRR